MDDRTKVLIDGSKILIDGTNVLIDGTKVLVDDKYRRFFFENFLFGPMTSTIRTKHGIAKSLWESSPGHEMRGNLHSVRIADHSHIDDGNLNLGGIIAHTQWPANSIVQQKTI